ncbi:MAG TPA: phosphoglycolate phosphatase [Lachnospiraceae bacterium]|nr:phosphoglycolate phosphatase [Lachnospiraceae bacterium]
MKYKYLLFDLDGTLTDPREGITTSVQYALRAFGIEETDLDKLTPFIGPPLRESFMQFYGFTIEQAETAVEKYREWFRPKGIFQNSMYPGIKEMLEMLRENGKILAVASSKPQIFVEQILHHFGIYQYFTVIVGSELDGRRDTKEEVVAEALRQLKESGMQETVASKAVMIGDRKFDIAGGKEHGLITAGVTFGYAAEGELEEAGADFVVDTVEELGRLLMQ